MTHAYEPGDPVSLAVRSSNHGVTTGWNDMIRKSLPRFGTNTMTNIIPEFQKETLATDTEFKLKFTFSERRFLLPWIEIANGKGIFANTIVFQIQYMGNDIRNVRVEVENYPSLLDAPPSRIKIKYAWHEIPTTDEEMGLRVIFVSSLILGTIGVVVTLCM